MFIKQYSANPVFVPLFATEPMVAERLGAGAPGGGMPDMGGMEAGDAKRLPALEAENAKLKPIVADQMLDVSAMKDLLQKHW